MWIDNPGELDSLYELFPLPCDHFRTDGIGDGIILKFKTFYLKIYDCDSDQSAYTVKGYLYGDPNPTIVDVVPYNKMREYAAKYRSEDYLGKNCGEYIHRFTDGKY